MLHSGLMHISPRGIPERTAMVITDEGSIPTMRNGPYVYEGQSKITESCQISHKL